MKKKLFFIAALLAVLIASAACGTIIPMDESSSPGISTPDITSDVESTDIKPESDVSLPEESLPQSESANSEPEDVSLPSYSENESSEESSYEESSEASSDISVDISDEPSTSHEESVPEESSAPEQPSETVGSLFSSYYRILKSGKYVLKTVESKIVGGEAMPYTTTVYHNGSVVYITIEESYGATSELLIKDGNTYWLDSISKQAIRTPGTDSLDAERTLYADGLRYLRNEIYKSYDTEYTCEVYTDSRGREFSFGFSSFGELRLYRFYDAAKKDIITIDIDISANIAPGQFDIPDGYTIVG